MVLGDAVEYNVVERRMGAHLVIGGHGPSVFTQQLWYVEELFVWIFSNFPPSFIPSPHPSSPPGAIKREQAAERKVPP